MSVSVDVADKVSVMSDSVTTPVTVLGVRVALRVASDERVSVLLMVSKSIDLVVVGVSVYVYEA